MTGQKGQQGGGGKLQDRGGNRAGRGDRAQGGYRAGEGLQGTQGVLGRECCRAETEGQGATTYGAEGGQGKK